MSWIVVAIITILMQTGDPCDLRRLAVG